MDPFEKILVEDVAAVIPTKHNAPLSLGVVCVNTSARTVDWSLISRDEGDIGQNSPSVQIEANAAEVVSCWVTT